jgi:hypothetical protein
LAILSFSELLLERCTPGPQPAEAGRDSLFRAACSSSSCQRADALASRRWACWSRRRPRKASAPAT